MPFKGIAHTAKEFFLGAPEAPLDTKSSLAAPDAAFLALFGATPTISGASVTPATALTVPAVAAAVGLLSATAGTLPVKVFRKLPEGGKEPATDHPSFHLIHDEANGWTSAGQLRQQLTADALLYGNGFAFCNRVNGKVQELIRLDPTTVTPQVDAASGEPSFKIGQGRGSRILSFRDVLHIPAQMIASDGLTGIAPVHLAREAIAVAMVLEQHAARLFGRGARPSGVLSFENKLDADTAKRISESWHAAHGGENSGKTAVLEQGGKFEPITFSSVDAQFAEMRSFQIIEICRAFRVQPQFVMDFSRATWSNAEQMNTAFLQYSVLPWLRTFEAAYRRVLLSPDDRKEYSIEFIVDDFLRADTAARASAYQAFRSAGVMTANEIRRLENLPALPDGDSLSSPFTTSNSTDAPPEANQ